ncbi:hypothetical protein CsSME_00029598 [Camellia sinensis var. sinensis]
MRILTGLLVRLRGYLRLARSKSSEVEGSATGAETTSGGRRRSRWGRKRSKRRRREKRLVGVSGEGLIRRGGMSRRGNKLMRNSRYVLIKRDLKRK